MCCPNLIVDLGIWVVILVLDTSNISQAQSKISSMHAADVSHGSY